MEDYDDSEPDIHEQTFHNTIREHIIFLLLFLLLYLFSFAVLGRFRRRGLDDYYSLQDEDEVLVYRISGWLCAASLAVAIGAVLLLPVSIAANEVLVSYPHSFYVKWLNHSLIQGLWNYVFLFSNLSLFVFLPFAYLFTESEGCWGWGRKRLTSRIYETVVVLLLLSVAVLGTTYVMSALIDPDNSDIQTILNLWTYYLPFLYSCISFFGVVILLVCTPLGFVRLFDVVGEFLVQPRFLRDLDEEYDACAMEEEWLRRQLRKAQLQGEDVEECLGGGRKTAEEAGDEGDERFEMKATVIGRKLMQVETRRKLLDKQRRTSPLQRNVIYPLAVLVLLGLTMIAVLMVIQNTLSFLIGIKALPSSSKQFTLGVSSLSRLGPWGACLEIVLIVYLIVTSSIGLYTAPCARRFRPKKRATPFTLLIANCALLLVVSSALPLLAKILGITNFDLLGDFGSIEWLGNFKLVLLYNLSFATAATACVFNKFTAKVRRELYARLVENYLFLTNCVSFIN
ncbi:unnamed protein product [Acanthoscelides obtectus]|uniref:Protein LMBR1L n=1 Tax=Acanthoscelides obtectus TaxID=200917 RepID=A0A9P0MEN7_ACAOB|nr:unnamed protein product [Acanthoscelides obtectus]CAK1639514.1 Protein Lilipod [Acanthoscelides obtectus]